MTTLTDRQQRIQRLAAGAESEHMRKLVDSAPEPTAEQLSALALILRTVTDDDDDGAP